MLTELDSGLWVVRAPLRFLRVQVGRNMAVVRLGAGDLLVHSPWWAISRGTLRRE